MKLGKILTGLAVTGIFGMWATRAATHMLPALGFFYIMIILNILFSNND